MDSEFRLSRARIRLQKENPFFAYLSLYLSFKEGKDLPEWAGMGVNQKGELFYKPEFVEKCSDDELVGVLTHEIGHLFLEHLGRLGGRDLNFWNISTDIVINSLLTKNKFKLPDGCLIPDYEEKIVVFGKTIKECNNKIAEQIYEEFEENKRNKNKGEENEESGNNGKRKVKGKYRNGEGGFDKHYFSEDELTEFEKKELKKVWRERSQEALVLAKMRGNIPIGVERLIGDIHKEKINWKALLMRYIQSYCPIDYSWAKPSKKSVSVGTYLPDIIKEKIDISVCIDLSGSIGVEEYSDFLSEIVGMARAFQEKMTIHFYSHDTEGYYGGEVRNGNIEKIKGIKLKGGGGTSHKPVIEMINKDRKCKLVIFLTDGCSDLNEIDFGENYFDSLFIISKEGFDEQLKGKKVKIIHLKE